MRRKIIIPILLLLLTSCSGLNFVDEAKPEDDGDECYIGGDIEPNEDVRLIGSGEQSPYYIVTADPLNVRERPSTDSEIIGSLSQGEEVEVTDKEGDWMEIAFDEEKGYVSADYLEKKEDGDDAATASEEESETEEPADTGEGEESPEEDGGKRVVCDADVLNVRSFPDTEAEIRGTLERGDEAEIIMDTDLTRSEWVKIRTGDLTGYVVKEYLSPRNGENQ